MRVIQSPPSAFRKDVERHLEDYAGHLEDGALSEVHYLGTVFNQAVEIVVVGDAVLAVWEYPANKKRHDKEIDNVLLESWWLTYDGEWEPTAFDSRTIPWEDTDQYLSALKNAAATLIRSSPYHNVVPATPSSPAYYED